MPDLFLGPVATTLIVTPLIVLLLIACSAFFSAAETSLTAVTRARLYRLVMDGNKRAIAASRLRREKESFISAILLGNTALNIVSSALATSLAITYFGEDGIAIAACVMTVLVLLFGELMPKTIAILNAERVALMVAPLTLWCVRIFTPLVYAMNLVNRSLLRLLGIPMSAADGLVPATEAIRGAIELHHKEGNVVKQDRDMLGSILDLGDIEVADIMIHRKDMLTIDASLSAQEIVQKAIETGHSRVPLWRSGADNIIGILHVKDLLDTIYRLGREVTHETLETILVPPWFIPDSTTLKDQLFAFRQRRQHFALVVDEYGALLGMVTLEDIIEEIVGEIDDEHDQGEIPGIVKRGENMYEIQGRATIRDVNRALEWNLPDDHASTIAGLVIHESRTIPEVGASFEFHRVRFTVLARTRSQITRLKAETLVEQIANEALDI